MAGNKFVCWQEKENRRSIQILGHLQLKVRPSAAKMSETLFIATSLVAKHCTGSSSAVQYSCSLRDGNGVLCADSRCSVLNQPDSDSIIR